MSVALEDRDFEFCAAITRKGGSNLWYVSQSLPLDKQRFFTSAYASMRYIDDCVDEDFLQRDSSQRVEQRDSFLRKVDIWEEKTRQAVSGCVSVPDTADNMAPLYRALAATVGKSDLGDGPWRDMACAMRRDVCEVRIAGWDDFYAYCDGATVAPATVYLYVLACQTDDTGHFVLPTGLPELKALATDMAVFCYLVHIMRDLTKDMQQDKQLLTLPKDIADQAQQEPDSVGHIVGLLGDRAHRHRAEMQKAIRTLAPFLGDDAVLTLNTLLGIYENIHAMLTASPQSVLSVSPQDMDTLGRESLKQ